MDAEIERRVDGIIDRYLKELGLNGNIVHRRMEAMLRNRIDFKIERKVAEEVPRVLAQRVGVLAAEVLREIVREELGKRFRVRIALVEDVDAAGGGE